MTAAAVIE